MSGPELDTPLLLDTHVLVWLMTGSPRLSPSARTQIEVAASAGTLFVSVITPWEIAMLTAKSRLALDRDVGEWIAAALSLPGITLFPLSPDVAVASTRLPDGFHADPADRIIVATARHLGAEILSEDGLILAYGDQGHVKVLRAGV